MFDFRMVSKMGSRLAYITWLLKLPWSKASEDKFVFYCYSYITSICISILALLALNRLYFLY
jgi:hypothetical protein